MAASEALRLALLEGLVIPAHPLALTAERKLDEKRQVALTRYYAAAGAGGSPWASTRRSSDPEGGALRARAEPGGADGRRERARAREDRRRDRAHRRRP
jgi:hypothetical protein